MSLNKRKIVAFGTSVCFPVASFVHILRHPQVDYYKTVFVLFFTFVGVAFFYVGDSADVTRYVADFKYLHTIGKIGFFEYFRTVPDLQQIDYYSVFMQWLVSRFTGNPKVYLGLLSMVYSMFFAINVEYIIDKTNNNTKLWVLLIVLLIVTPKMTSITHRWWTALQVFLYGALPVIFERKYIRIVWCIAATVLIHFSFLYPLALLVVALLLPKRTLWPYLLVFVISNTLADLNFNAIIPYVERFLPEMTADRTISYINSEEFDHNFFSTSARLFMNIANAVLAIWIYFRGKHALKEDKSLRTIYVASLLIGSFAMITNLTEWGWRYLDLSNTLLVCLYIYYLSINIDDASVNGMFRMLSPVFIYFIVFQIRGFLSIIGPFQLFAGNYFTTWFLNDSFSVLDMIKYVL